MRAPLQRLLLCVAVLVAAGAPLRAQEAPPAPDSAACEVVRAIEVRGNTRMSADAVRFDLAIKPGSRWDEAALHREFLRFWNRGYFADLRFTRRCESGGAVLVVHITERPTLTSVTYDKAKDVSQTQIEDYYKQRDFQLTVGTPLDRKRVWRAQTMIEELLGQKGYMDAQVTAVINETSPSTRTVHFKIRSGGKTRIAKLDFVGNQAYKDAKLRDQLTLIKPHRWYLPWSSKSLYHPLKFQQDANNVVQYYKDRGYLDADLRPAVVEVRAADPEKARREAEERAQREQRKAEKKARKAAKKGEPPPAVPAPGDVDVRQKKWVYLTVPVDEGKVYTLGDVKFEGNTVFSDEALRQFVPQRSGAVLSDAALEAGIGAIRALYGTRGYVYSAVTRRFERREGDVPIADVVIQVEEDQAYTLRRIEFRGNTTTNDVVLRREMNVAEGELLNRVQLDVSVQKLKQLGYWVPADEPVLEPVPGRPEVDIRVQGEEQTRNEVQVGAGYSEFEGAFFAASYGTRNFLGRGEALDLSVSVGGRSSRASINFSEPWFLGRPNTFGFQLYRRTYDYARGVDASGQSQSLTQASTGGALSLGRRIRDFWLAQVTYSLETSEYDTLFNAANAPNAPPQTAFTTVERRFATITPIFSYRRVNNPLRPTRGIDFRIVPQVSAEALGGDNNFYSPSLAVTFYHPLFKRLFVAAHAEAEYARYFGTLERECGTGIEYEGIPTVRRFYLGGDTIGPRVFETRTISPIRPQVLVDQFCRPTFDALGNPVTYDYPVGGNKKALLQFELGLPVGKTATFAAFVDAGGVWAEGDQMNWDDTRVSAGFEFRVFLPVFQAPIRLIYGWPVQAKPFDQTTRFQFSIGLPF